METQEIIKAVKKCLAKIRPYLNDDGGDVDYVDFKDVIVYVRLLGACVGCSSSDLTLKNGIEAMLLEEVPGVIGVEQVKEDI